MHASLNTTPIFMFQNSEFNLGEAESKVNVAFIALELKIYTQKLASLSNKSLLSSLYLM